MDGEKSEVRKRRVRWNNNNNKKPQNRQQYQIHCIFRELLENTQTENVKLIINLRNNSYGTQGR